MVKEQQDTEKAEDEMISPFKVSYWAARNDVESTMRCEYCLDKEWEDNDEIMMCDRCNASVHVKCSMHWDK